MDAFEMQPKNASGGDAPPPSSLDQSLSDQWRAHQRKQPQALNEPTLLRLPSGLQVRARRPHLLLMLKNGKVPDSLTPRVHELIAVAQAGGDAAVTADLEREQATDPAKFYAEWLNLLELVWLEAVIDPSFTADPESNPDAIPISDVTDDDKTFLFVWAQGVDQTVAEFLDGKARSTPHVGVAPMGNAVQPRPSDPAGD